MNVFVGMLCGLVALIGFGLTSAFAVEPVKKLGEPKAFFYRNIVVVALLGVMLAVTGMPSQVPWAYVVLGAVVSFIGYIPVVAYYRAIKVGNLSIVSAVSKLSVVVTVLLSVVFLHERLTLEQVGAMVVILVSTTLMSLQRMSRRMSGARNSEGIALALLASLIWGLVFFLFAYLVQGLGALFAAFVIEAGGVVWSGLHMLTQGDRLRIKEVRLLRLCILTGMSGAVAVLAYNYGILYAPVSIIAGLSAASPLVTLAYDTWVQRKVLSRRQYLSLAGIIIGVVLLASL